MRKKLLLLLSAIFISILIKTGISNFIETKESVDLIILFILIFLFFFIIKSLIPGFIHKSKKLKRSKKLRNTYSREKNKLDNMIDSQLSQLISMDETLSVFKNNFLTLSAKEEELYRNTLSSILDFIKNMANTINSTTDIKTFVKAYNALDIAFTILEKHEYTGYFSNNPPSKNHQEILAKKHYTEMDFIKRSFSPNTYYLLTGTLSEYFYTFTPDTIMCITGKQIASNANSFDNMEGHDFEYFCSELLKKNGFYNVEVTQGSGDHGIDILAEKDGITYAIQCKCYSSNIGNSAVQQAHTGKSLYHKDIAVVMTNRYFTAQAIEEAKELGVKLWDRDKLYILQKNLNENITQNITVSKSNTNIKHIKDLDPLFEEAGKFIIERDKASIGIIQRCFQISFNRAAHLMDQLAEAGVVDNEAGTSPRKILMSMDEFDNYINSL